MPFIRIEGSRHGRLFCAGHAYLKSSYRAPFGHHEATVVPDVHPSEYLENRLHSLAVIKLNATCEGF